VRLAAELCRTSFGWLTPKPPPQSPDSALRNWSIELVTVIGSNHFSLGDYITPDLFFQLQSLKEHMGIDSFANYQ